MKQDPGRNILKEMIETTIFFLIHVDAGLEEDFELYQNYPTDRVYKLSSTF